jgi:hypothetical protein
MMNSAQPSFDASEQAVLEEIAQHLRAEGWGAGWAIPLTVTRLLRDWQRLSARVARCSLDIDKYRNDVDARDGLEIVLAKCPEPLRAKLNACIEMSDKEFIAGTTEDITNSLGYSSSGSSGWWLKRKPTEGPLAEYLARHPSKRKHD